MNTTFRTTFDLARAGADAATVFAEAAGLGLHWALSRADRPAQRRLAAHDAAAPLARQEVARGASLEVLSEPDGEQRLWSLRLVHPDGRDASVHWQAELGLRQRGSRVTFSCWLYFVSRGGALRGVQRSYSRPRIVRDLLDHFDASAGLPLSASIRTIAEADVGSLVENLRSPDRKRPLLYVSCRNDTDRPAIDTAKLGERLAALAHVCVARSRFPSFKLQDRIPEGFGCWDGAVRLYWPGLKDRDNPFRHPLWTREQLRDLRDGERTLDDALFDDLCRLSAMVSDPEAVEFSTVESAARRKLIDELRERGQFAELVSAVDEENKQLKKKVGELEDLVLEWQERCETAAAKAEGLQDALVALQRAQANRDAAEEADSAPPEISNVADAVEEARSRLGDRLVFALNGKSEVKNNPFKRPEDLFRFLEFLATTYHDHRTNAKTCADLDLACRNACGWKYEPHQSKQTMEKYSEWYRTSFDGRKFWLGPHAGTGASKDPHTTIRVAFDWDDESQKVVVGFIGQHQETDKTS